MTKPKSRQYRNIKASKFANIELNLYKVIIKVKYDGKQRKEKKKRYDQFNTPEVSTNISTVHGKKDEVRKKKVLSSSIAHDVVF